MQSQPQMPAIPMQMNFNFLQQYPQPMLVDSIQQYYMNQELPQNRQSNFLNCQHCQQNVQSKVEFKYGKGALLFSVLALKTGICCLVPCIFNEFKDAVHTCPMCKRELGRRKFLFYEQ